MSEESFVPPQFVYLDDLIRNQIDLNDAIANYRVHPGPKTRRALLSSVAALYMKLRVKLKQDKADYSELVDTMDAFLKQGIRPDANGLITCANQLNGYIDSTGATYIHFDKRPLDKTKAVKGRFRQ